MKNFSIALVTLLTVFLAACGSNASSPSAGSGSQARKDQSPVTVAVSVPPQKFFVDRLSGGLVETLVMVPGGSFPHSYEPKPQQLATLAEADAYFAVGVPFEDAWLERLRGTNPDLRIVRTDAHIDKRVMAEPHVCTEDHDHAHHHHHGHGAGNIDPHLWLAPQHARAQAETMLQTLVKIDPGHADVYMAGFERLSREIDALNAEIAGRLAQDRAGDAFFVYHPSWGYFADAFGLEQIPVEIEGKEPGPQDLKRLIDLAKEKGVSAIIVQPQTAARGAQALAQAIGAEIVTLDPLAEDWDANMRRAAEAIASAAR